MQSNVVFGMTFLAEGFSDEGLKDDRDVRCFGFTRTSKINKYCAIVLGILEIQVGLQTSLEG